jgi:predicted dienelactone hydrolase
VGGGFTAASVTAAIAPPNGALAVRQSGNPAHTASADPRIKAVIAIGPWGWRTGFWDAAGLAAIKTPLFFMAGGIDGVSGYSPGIRNIFEASVNAPRHLLTFENANHNAAAPMPAPKESWAAVPHLPVIPAAHYIDAVWDTVRMNNIAQHFATAFMARHLRADAGMDAYLTLAESSKDGKWSMETDGKPKADHTYWKGFANRTAVGLRLETRKP